ncbi:MAG: hypothetical protein OEW48_08595, partial [Phycisphaerae bacterium]|nr:hypothetical protein [Phycisphaerae bacterium]
MRSIWAVATNTIKQALRMKIAAVFIVLLIVLLPVMGLSMTGDGTIKGRLQTFVSYSLSLTNLLLCLLTIIVTIYTLTSDIKQRQIYTVITKPIRRYQLLLGKLLGVVLLNSALLALFSAIIYTITIYTPKFSIFDQADLIQVENEFFTARAALVPPEVDVTKEVLDAYERLERDGQLPPDVPRSKFIEDLTKRKQLEKRAAVVGEQLVWEFHNVKVLNPTETLFIRYKYDVSINPPDSQVYGQWEVGDSRQYPAEVAYFPRKDPIRTFRELEFPAALIADDGYLAIRFLNVQLNDTTVMFPPDGLEVLYKADTFTANFIRVVLLILFRLIFLASLSLLASTFLSFPVAILFSLCILVTAIFSAFCLESFDYLGKDLSWVYHYTVRPIILLLPQFDKFSPAKYLVPARLLSWPLLAKVAGL